jgi:hypothetical protein
VATMDKLLVYEGVYEIFSFVERWTVFTSMTAEEKRFILTVKAVPEVTGLVRTYHQGDFRSCLPPSHWDPGVRCRP